MSLQRILARIEWKEGENAGGVCFLVLRDLRFVFVPERQLADSSAGYDFAQMDAMYLAVRDDKHGVAPAAACRVSGTGGGAFPCSISS